MHEDFQPRLKASDLEERAAKRLAELQAEGIPLRPVVNKTRKLAKNFWGAAWMKQLAHCESGGMCLAPGRTLLRHSCVLHVDVEPCSISALISAEELYEVEVRLAPLDEERLEELAACCTGRIDSLLSLLNGKTDEAVLKQLCHPETGLLPTPEDWSMSCTCPDWAEPCPHAAAAIYAVGSLIDEDPALLFTLRGISPEHLIASPTPPVELNTAQLASMFGIDLDMGH